MTEVGAYTAQPLSCIRRKNMEKPIIDGFVFHNAKDTELAKKEYIAIKKLKNKINIDNLDEMIELYIKLATKKYFVTPVGLSFVRDMRDYLVERAPDRNIPPIYVDGNSDNKEKSVIQSDDSKKYLDEIEGLKSTKKKMTVAIVSLIIVIIGMFFIVATNENIGYFNAEEKVLNKYSAWQERLQNWENELNEREAAIKYQEDMNNQ